MAKAAGIENDVGLVRIVQKKLPKITRNDNAKVRNIRGPQESAKGAGYRGHTDNRRAEKEQEERERRILRQQKTSPMAHKNHRREPYLPAKRPCERDFTLEDQRLLEHDTACLHHSLPCPDVFWPGDISTRVSSTIRGNHNMHAESSIGNIGDRSTGTTVTADPA